MNSHLLMTGDGSQKPVTVPNKPPNKPNKPESIHTRKEIFCIGYSTWIIRDSHLFIS
jgi:hypothetical protein